MSLYMVRNRRELMMLLLLLLLLLWRWGSPGSDDGRGKRPAFVRELFRSGTRMGSLKQSTFIA